MMPLAAHLLPALMRGERLPAELPAALLWLTPLTATQRFFWPRNSMRAYSESPPSCRACPT